ncbi:MAG: hypothetical protein Fur0025_13280 [Oscillatoriaceae cyanobacterium]
MLEKLIQAATITFLLHLVLNLTPPTAQRTSEAPFYAGDIALNAGK